jgi:hypothetical protein
MMQQAIRPIGLENWQHGKEDKNTARLHLRSIEVIPGVGKEFISNGWVGVNSFHFFSFLAELLEGLSESLQIKRVAAAGE